MLLTVLYYVVDLISKMITAARYQTAQTCTIYVMDVSVISVITYNTNDTDTCYNNK